ncbi:hypothetical protein FNW25_09270 [Flavobacterium franklandianum]|uniref:Uncharacterized protein n=1 Tax=Flavobacterium franklandianum TaxID=2594430 RepID=A0A553CUA1_9FLAO|nr:hypothetical protein [Flavobacterium franklandianum]TRX24041.1 hypothetical protein FNW17_02370 [Flavobacterium franklandianum]TRX25375.1 hypothetical protein FNW25_09270 [Flavobacterium franklandianum]
MRKKVSTLLLLIITTTFLYNVVGFHLLFTLQKEHSWVVAMQNIPDSEFKVIKLNATLYTFTEDTEMEYVNENMTINNKVYHIFKRKIQDNIISLYYLPNKQQSTTDVNLKKIVDNDELDNAPLSKKPMEKLLKSVIKDYFPHSSNAFVFVYKSKECPLKFDFHPQGILHSGYLSLADSPPDLV